jgi:hypothetical protein
LPAITSLGHVIYDASGNPLSGGKLRVYTANTTSLATLYSDEGLSVALSNPVIANSEGRPSTNGSDECVVYVAAGTYDIAELSAADAVLRSWDDYLAGGEGGDISRTVTGDARLLITGAGGEVLIQAGPPTGTDVGGDLTLEGWAGTQLDTLTLDAALATFTGDVAIDGSLEVGGEPIPAIVTSGTLSAASTLTIPITGGFHSYTIELYDIAPTNATALSITVSIDNASTYVAGTNYSSYSLAYDASATSSVSAASWIGTVGNMSITAGKAHTLSLDLDTVLSGTGDSSFVGSSVLSGLSYRVSGVVTAGGRITHVKFTAGAGTFTCKWRLRNRG